MKNTLLKQNIFLTLMALLVSSMPTHALGEKPSDFVGDSFYTESIINSKGQFKSFDEIDNKNMVEDSNCNPSKTIPPVKLIRLKLKAYQYLKEEEKQQKQAPVIENLEQEIVQDVPCFENDDNKKAQTKRKKKAQLAEKTQISVDCKYMDYQTETGCMNANGNVVVTFPHQGTILKADTMVYNKLTNKMHAEGNVVIIRGGLVTNGESIDIDLNEESIFIDKPITNNTEIKIVSEEGYVQRNIVTQTNGRIDVERSTPLIFRTSGGPDIRHFMNTMVIPEEEQKYITDGKSKIFRIQANEIIINAKENLDILQLKKAQLTTENKKILKIPRLKIYSNKGHEFVEGNYPELGSRRYLGMFIGPGFIVELPKGSLLKLIPALTYKGKIGVGGVARFWSGTNETQVGYGTSKSNIVVRGEQVLDDNLKLIYGSYDYMDNWFLGRRAPKYGADIVYRKRYSSNLFTPKLSTTYEHRFNAGYFHDLDKDAYFKKIQGHNISTTRFRYMGSLSQTLYSYKTKDKMFNTNLSLIFSGSAAMYGTGDTQIIGRVGPNWHLQYHRWMQDIGYTLSAFDDNSPIPVYDAYRYGRSQVYLREYLRVCPYLTLAWQGSVTLSDDTYTNNMFQECSFYASVGPQDLRVNFGYDFVRQNAFINLLMAIDPKGTTIDFDKIVIKNPDNFNKQKAHNEEIYKAAHITQPSKKTNNSGVLTKAVVSNIKEDFDDI